jgi:CheY-like chemotaxis protein
VSDRTTPPVILIVEDEWILRAELADALIAESWCVIEAPSGEHALTHLAGDRQFDLVVTDVRLGGSVLGWEVAAAWRKRSPYGPVIYVSANNPEDPRRMPDSIFLGKPVVLPLFIQSCRKLLRAAGGG